MNWIALAPSLINVTLNKSSLLILLLTNIFIIWNTELKYYNNLDPFILPKQQVDRGAIRFILSGANIMCPGLTSPGGKMVPTEKETIVVSFLL